MPSQDRLHALDAVRAFALLLGIAFHATLSFVPDLPRGIWAMTDNSPSAPLGQVFFVSHIFRMSLFFFIAGFFARLLYHRQGARSFWSNRLKRILGPLVVGWIVLFPLIAVVWVWGLTQVFGGTLPKPPPEMTQQKPGAFPLTHLWFLYYLLLLYAAMLAGRGALIALDRSGRIRALIDRLVRGLLSGYGTAFLLGLPLSVCLYVRPSWLYWQGIPTPDRSLIPELASFVGFGTAIVFGWLVHRQMNLLPSLQQRWQGHLIVALVATAICSWIAGPRFVITPAEPGTEKIAFAILYGIAVWGWVLAITGIGLRFFSIGSPTLRYVSDSSYWLYLAHLPVVAAFQVIVGHWNMHWGIKYPLVLAASFAVLFASYHYLVRPTIIGACLNGRRYPRRRSDSAEPPAPPSSLEGAPLRQ